MYTATYCFSYLIGSMLDPLILIVAFVLAGLIAKSPEFQRINHWKTRSQGSRNLIGFVLFLGMWIFGALAWCGIKLLINS